MVLHVGDGISLAHAPYLINIRQRGWCALRKHVHRELQRVELLCPVGVILDIRRFLIDYHLHLPEAFSTRLKPCASHSDGIGSGGFKVHGYSFGIGQIVFDRLREGLEENVELVAAVDLHRIVEYLQSVLC